MIIIGLRHSTSPRRSERSCLEILCSFDVNWRFLINNSEESCQQSSGFSIDVFISNKENIKNIDFTSFRSALSSSTKINLNENDRLCYIDNDNDEIPIEQQSEFHEALKFGQKYYSENQKNIPLIIIKTKKQSEEFLIKKTEKLKSQNKISTMKMESTNSIKTIHDTNLEQQQALHWFHDFLKNYKQEIIADVTKQVLKKISSALISQNLETTEYSSPEISPTSLDKINTLYKIIGPPSTSDEFIKITNNNSELDSVKVIPKDEENNWKMEFPKNSTENDENANKKQQKSESDNNSILSDNSHMSEFLLEDDNYEIVQNHEETEIEKSNHDESSSFELISENSSPNEKYSDPEKEIKKPIICMFYDETNSSDKSDQIFAIDAHGKAYIKNIIEKSKENSIDPELDKRSGGNYSFIKNNLPQSTEYISTQENCKIPRDNVEADETAKKETEEIFLSNKTSSCSADISNSNENQDVLFDHNVSKGLGDTKQTSPKRHSNIKSERRYTYRQPRNPQYSSFSGCSPDIENHGPWRNYYGSHVPPHMNQSTYPPPYGDPMQILPETLISGAVHAASSAYTTARKVIEKIRSQQVPSPNTSKSRKF